MKKTDINKKREKEKQMVSYMIALYCKKNHQINIIRAVSIKMACVLSVRSLLSMQD